MILTLRCIGMVVVAGGGVSCGAGAAPPQAPAASPVPVWLDQLESGAEDIFDLALAERWDVAQRQTARLREQWPALRQRLTMDGADAASLTALDDALAELQPAMEEPRDALRVARAANAVSAPLADVFARYRADVPARVLDLDYRGREILLDAKAGEASAAAADVGALAVAWGRLRGEVEAAGGARVAERYSRTLEAMHGQAARADLTALTMAANRSLEQVDDIERVFTPPKQRSTSAR